MDPFLVIAFLALGAAVGGTVTWLIIRGKGESARLVLSSKLEEAQSRIESISSDVKAKDGKLEESREETTHLKTRISQLQTTLDKERETAEEKLALLNEAKQTLTDTFKALSLDALEKSNTSFLELAKATLEKFQKGAEGDLDKRQQAISELVNPMEKSIAAIDQKIHSFDKAHVELKERIRNLAESEQVLRKETGKLATALRSSSVRGRWGEIQLRRVVELAEMVSHCDFYEQESVTTEDRRLRADMIVRLPGGKSIVVDSKAVLSAYLESQEAETEDERNAKLKDHARQMRDSINDLSKKAYWEQFEPTPDFVVLFIPGENFFSAALEQDPTLIEYGAQKHIILATPTTLIALLRVVYYGWRQESLQENAREISDLGKDLYERLATMGGHIAELGKSLDKSVDSYNKTIKSIESRVLPSARKFKDLGAVGDDAEIAPLPPVEQTTRRLQAPEMFRRDKERNIGAGPGA